MLIKYTAKKELIPFFALGFIINAFSETPNLLYTALLGIVIGLVYISLKPTSNNS
jgi:mannose/fructose/N-acetylgalactosamine-specific phosphotransferase system component IIC